ncbi:hypothetical protein P7C73_g5804, partial [Tremellales sp. Uapishka_1]
MSTITLSPHHGTPDYASLPHAQSDFGKPPHAPSYNGRPIGGRPRSSTLTATSTHAGPSRSAPASPSASAKSPIPGLVPLSHISRMDLDTPRTRPSGVAPSSQSTSLPGPGFAYDPKRSQPFFFSSGTITRPAVLASRQPPGSSTPGPSKPRSRSRSRIRPSASTSSSEDTETETEVDSDSTFVPGRTKQQSKSQPDLLALRSRLVEGWADGVMRTQLEERRVKLAHSHSQPQPQTQPLSHPPPQPQLQGRRTPPSRPISLSTFPTSPRGHSRSQSSLVTLRSSLSPRNSTVHIPRLSPLTSTTALSSGSEGSPRVGGNFRLDGISSEDADDDYDGTDSPSSGSLTFSPKRSKGLRQRQPDRTKGGLGLSLEPETATHEEKTEDIKVDSIEDILKRSSLVSLRLLAIVPSLWGIFVLSHAVITGGLYHDVWPWGVDFSREALERLVQQGHGDYEGLWRPVPRGDMLLSIAWAICTAHFCFCLTTGLTYRWRSYYSLPSTFTRLVSLQCLCWPMTYLTLITLGPHRPLLSWVVIGVTTGWSRTIQMWVTSNVVAGDITPSNPPHPPDELGWWDKFTWGRRWNWDNVAREVGWKIGTLLLFTTAWLFWSIDAGTVQRR